MLNDPEWREGKRQADILENRRRLLPELKGEVLESAAERFRAYLDVAFRVFERIQKDSAAWSHDDLEREIRANLVYRAFRRTDAAKCPMRRRSSKIARALRPEA